MKIKALKLLTLVCLLIACALPVLFLSGKASSEPDPSLAGLGLGSLETSMPITKRGKLSI